MKRCLIGAMAASMLVAFVGIAQAENGMPSQSTLRAMGLSGMQVMSDREAMDVRGMGYYSHNSTAIAFGVSYANVGGHGGGAGSFDGFYAKGNYYASGSHGSYAGKIVVKSSGGNGGGPPHNNNRGGGPPHGGGGHTKVKSTFVFAGGYATSSAH